MEKKCKLRYSKNIMQSWLKQKIKQYISDVKFDVLIPSNHLLADYSTNVAFILAKRAGRKPEDIAQEIITYLMADPEIGERFEKITFASPGYINFFIKHSFLKKQLCAIAKNRRYGAQSRKNTKIIVEYSSPNIAKTMHAGHLRSTIIGDALANIFSFLGYDTIRWNFLGDWGTQFGKLIAAYKRWGNQEELKVCPSEVMSKLYVDFHRESVDNPEFEKEGQNEFKKLEEKDSENHNLWRWFREESLKEFEKTYDMLGIDASKMIFKGESDYENSLQPLVKELHPLLEESEGALIFNLEKYNLPPALIQKSDKASLYLTRDIASLKDRINKFHPEKILYVVSNQQTLHFEQLFAISDILDVKTELVHVKFGLVLGDDKKKLATRKGKVIPLKDVVLEAIVRSRAIVEEKNPNLSESEKERVARAIGVGALKYNDLKEHRNSDIIFNWDHALDLTGNSGPYIQYTYARLLSIVRKVKFSMWPRADTSLLNEETEIRLLKHLIDFPGVLVKSSELYTTNGLALYLYELASLASRYYEKVRILNDHNKKRRNARIMLIKTIAVTLKRGLNLLGIQALERV